MPADWHHLEASRVLDRLQAEVGGLSRAEAASRLAHDGPNELPAPVRRSPLRRLLEQFRNLLVQVLLVAGAITVAMGEYTDAAVIIGVTLINALIGFIQEGKAERALDAVSAMLAAEATVVRDGQRFSIPAADLVAGDLVLLGAGDRVPADLRLLDCQGLRIDESALTGESVPVGKDSVAVDPDAPLAERSSMAYSGTSVTLGQGRGVVVACAQRTELGRIGGLVSTLPDLATPLARKLDQLARRLTVFIVVGALFTFLFGRFFHQLGATEIFLAVVGLAVAAIPEGLPAIVTVALAIGTQRMARARAIVRRLPAVEALGSVTVICTDKTGTLTRNEMTVVQLITPANSYRVAGVGYAPDGDFICGDGQIVTVADDILALGRAAFLCNDARVWQEQGEWRVLGDPTELALYTLALKAGLVPVTEQADWPRLDAIPFDSALGMMLTRHENGSANPVIYAKGAPEKLLDLCDATADGVALDRAQWDSHVQRLAQDGQRVLALAVCRSGVGEGQLDAAALNLQFELLGLVGMIDPPRPEAAQAIAQCRAAGIQVKMITGDHAMTAAAIAGGLGLNASQPLTGVEIDASSNEELANRLRQTDVIARASPEHKMRLVNSLQQSGHIVSMTGDGVNDAPALKAADVGVAMGSKGTDAAREAADLVLADDNFATIARAVREGRNIYDNIKKSLLFILPTNGGEAAVILIAVLLGLALPVTAVQILWVNLVTTITLDVALAFERAERGVMTRPARPPSEPIITRMLLARVVYVTVLLTGMTFWLFDHELARGMSLEAARTSAVNMLVVSELIYLFNCRFFTESALSLRALSGNRIALLAALAVVTMQLAFCYLPLFNEVFGTQGPDALSWALVLGLSLLKFLVVEAEKAMLRRFGVSRL